MTKSQDQTDRYQLFECIINKLAICPMPVFNFSFRSTYLPIIIYPPYIIIRKKEDINSVTCTCKRSCIRVILLPQRTLASSIKNNIGPRSNGICLDILPETSTVLFLVLTFWIPIDPSHMTA